MKKINNDCIELEISRSTLRKELDYLQRKKAERMGFSYPKKMCETYTQIPDSNKMEGRVSLDHRCFLST